MIDLQDDMLEWRVFIPADIMRDEASFIAP